VNSDASLEEHIQGDGRVVVFHDGSCPLCRKEIAFFRRRVSPGAVRFVDVSRWRAAEGACGLRTDEAMARFHVRDRDGELRSGARAFAALWRVTPGLRLLGRVAAFEPVANGLEAAYGLFLKLRPALQRFAGAVTESRSGGAPGRGS
jgi:predicted DCC family thiol-disulfide oxidoreductase YuxK